MQTFKSNFQKLKICIKWLYGYVGKYYRVATLYKMYLTIYGRTYGRIDLTRSKALL